MSKASTPGQGQGGEVLRTDLIRPVPALLHDNAERHGEKVAFHDGVRSISYGELESRTRRLAGHFTELRLQPGDRAAIVLGNRVEMVESCFAVTRASGIAVPLDAGATDAELSYVLRDSGARLVVTDAVTAERVARASSRDLAVLVVGEEHVRTSSGPTLSYEARACTDSRAAARDDLELDLPAWMHYTAGTTGRPKGVLSSQRNCLWSVAACYVPHAGLSATDRVLWPLPLAHSLSHIACLLAVTAVGATARIVDGFVADDVLELLRTEEASVFAALPHMYYQLVQAAVRHGFRARDLRVCLVGGAVTTTALRRAFDTALGVELLDVYGSTETCGAITVGRSSGGLAVPGLGLRVVNGETGLEARAGEEGEVLVSGPGVMLGYHNRPDAMADAVREGWYHTGDLARRDAVGHLTVVGRIQEQITRAGETIHPGEIEAVVRDVPGVLDVAVVGRPHHVLGEVPIAFVVPGPDGVDSERVYAACRSRLPHAKVPDELYEIGAIPRTPLGKIMRHVLLDEPARLRAAETGTCGTLFRCDWVPLPSVPPLRPLTGRWRVADHAVARSLQSAGVTVVSQDEADVVVRPRGSSFELTVPGGGRTVVDLDGESEPGVALTRAAASGEPRVSVRSSVLLVPRLGRTHLGTTSPVRGGAVIVTGAGHPLVAAVTRHLVLAHGMRDVVLVGPARHAGRERDRLVTDLRAAAARVVTAECDLTSPAALTRAVPGNACLAIHGEPLIEESGAESARALAGLAKLMIFTRFDAAAHCTEFEEFADAVHVAWADLPERQALASFDAALTVPHGHLVAMQVDTTREDVPHLLRDLVETAPEWARRSPGGASRSAAGCAEADRLLRVLERLVPALGCAEADRLLRVLERLVPALGCAERVRLAVRLRGLLGHVEGNDALA